MNPANPSSCHILTRLLQTPLYSPPEPWSWTCLLVGWSRNKYTERERSLDDLQSLKRTDNRPGRCTRASPSCQDLVEVPRELDVRLTNEVRRNLWGEEKNRLLWRFCCDDLNLGFR